VAESIDKRHAALLAAVAERVCAVPRGEFLPLGPASRRVLDREVPSSESGDDAAQVRGVVYVQGGRAGSGCS
jgi:hypothetical protein